MANEPGTCGWIDLTVPNAEEVRRFYEAVLGWTTVNVPMGDYDDFAMVPPGAEAPVAGVCHARGANATQPSGWMLYWSVPNLDDALGKVRARGGEVVGDVRDMGEWGRMAVIRDPSGAPSVLIGP